jgi:hypothetical protein
MIFFDMSFELIEFSAKRKKVAPPMGLEHSTLSSLGERDNHYTTKPIVIVANSNSLTWMGRLGKRRVPVAVARMT